METIKVNMNPNPLDVQTIHASQNDGEARQWGFKLHNNGDAIDSSEVTDQMVFKAYKGGTEQLLPENGSTPTTSPFKGDIRYPQGLLTDQEFTYRQSPTEEDGLAKITDIKGNTIVWNQLVGTNVNGLSTIQGTTFTLNSNGSIHVTGTGTGNHFCEWRTVENPSFIMSKGHKYLVKFKGLTTGIVAQVGVYTTQTTYLINKVNLVGDYSEIFTPTQDGITASLVRFYTTNTFDGTTDIIMQLFDVTQMGLDITDPSEFTSLFPLSYYSYNQGSLLSFMGNGLKTVGKNLLPLNIMGNKSGIVYTYNNDGTISLSGTATSTITDRSPFTSASVATLKKNVAYRVSGCPSGGSANTYKLQVWNSTDNQAINTDYGNGATFTLPEDKSVAIRFVIYSGQNMDGKVIKPMITFADVDQTFEPYTESTLSLPISTYFPNGMKSAGSVYDELTESKAITRIGSVDLGTLSYFYNSSSSFFSATIPNLVNGMTYATESPNAIVQNYEYKGGGVGWANMPNMSYGFNGQDIRIKNTAYTSSAEFVNAVRGTYMVYELATYEETSFSTASLVTENAEIPLSAENDVLADKCTEELSSQPGFIDAKIKLTDGDGTCYSNKIQLHVERKP